MSLYGEMRRSFEAEILDSGGQQPEMLARVHRALSLTHSLLGNHGAILRALRRDGQAVQRVLDIGCGHGGLLEKVRRQIGADVLDRKSTRLNSSHLVISYAVFCLKKKKQPS